ncbi:MAG: hypothetical protein U0869_05705 [Chloroflexota bacterium]
MERRSWAFDIEDPALHAGLTQHAFALGHDQMALCGWQTPLKRAFLGDRAPLLSLAGPANPRCPDCAERTVPAPPDAPHVTPYVREHRLDGRTWLDDRLEVLGFTPPRRPRFGKRPSIPVRVEAGWPTQDIPLRLPATTTSSETLVALAGSSLVEIDSTWTRGAPQDSISVG